MQLGLQVDYSGRDPRLPMDVVLEAERLGFDSCWTYESWGADAVSPLAWIGALTSRIKLGTGIIQTAARTPATTAMTAMTLDALSGGRFILGVGPSGPQVIEGWHGMSYARPLTRSKEVIRIVREILRREQPLRFDGHHYQVPYAQPDATGLGKPLKSILHGRTDMKIYTAAITPAGVEAAAEVADGFLPIFTDPESFQPVYGPSIEAGQAKRAPERAEASFDIVGSVRVIVGDDISACRDSMKPELALYIGGMGARDKNFYKDLVCRMGYEGPANDIQKLYLEGHKDRAVGAVPDELVDAIALCGPRARIGERLECWKNSPVTTLCVGAEAGIEAVRMMAELAL